MASGIVRVISCTVSMFFIMFAGCVGDVEAREVRTMAGTFAYCLVDQHGACVEGGFTFRLHVSESGVIVAGKQGQVLGHMSSESGVWFQVIVDDPAQDGWPEVVELGTLGPGLWPSETVGRLLLATRLLEEAGGPAGSETGIGSATLAKGQGASVLLVTIRPSTASGDPIEHELRFRHADGVWPPQEIRYQSSAEEIDRRVYKRYSEQVERPIQLSLAAAPLLGGQQAQRVPAVPPEYGFGKDFAEALADAAYHPSVALYLQEHPDWLVHEASIERDPLESVVVLTMLQGCSGLRVQVLYRAGILPVTSAAPTTGSCRGDGDGLDALAEYQLPDPTGLIEFADRLEIDAPLRWLRYAAPTEDKPGPRTNDGGRTSLNGPWSAAFREPVQHEGRTFDVDHILTADLPGDSFAYYTTEVWPTG